MDKYKLVKYTKNTIIFKSGEKAKDYFYILNRGKVVSYNYFYDNYIIEQKRGEIIGLIPSITNEPYYATVEVVEEAELWQIKVENIDRINNKHLINKISYYLSFIFENWLSKYYTLITKNKIDLYNKEDILIMASIYKNNNFMDASHKLCNAYLDSFQEDLDNDKIKNFMKYLIPVKKPELVEGSYYKMYKGYCLYSELEFDDKIYYIKSGRVGIYSIVNSRHVNRAIYSSGYVINGGRPILEYTPLFTTAIVLEDSIIEILSYGELIKILYNDPVLRVEYIKMSSMKVISTIYKIKAVKKISIKDKLIVLIYSILKIETFFSKEQEVKLFYKVEDIKNMLGLEIENKDLYKEFEKIKYLELDTFKNIKILNADKYFKEYESYII